MRKERIGIKRSFQSSRFPLEDALLDLERQSKQGLKGLINLVEKISPKLFEVGSWLLGGLIALKLVVIGALATVGAVDKSILISATADFTIK